MYIIIFFKYIIATDYGNSIIVIERESSKKQGNLSESKYLYNKRLINKKVDDYKMEVIENDQKPK